MTSVPSSDEIVRRTALAVFSKPLLTNIHRAVVAEAIVAAALEPEWEWCSADYASYDFRRGDLRLEVKQSASLQSWNAATLKPSRCSFDIAERTGEWEDGVTWKPGAGRNADIYVFCHHPVVAPDADHRSPAQWRFFVLPEANLPKQKSLAPSIVERAATSVEWLNRKSAVNCAATAVRGVAHG